MNNMKKLASILLALVMVFTMTTFAFAADDGSITITNPASGETYTAYKIFDLTYTGEGAAEKVAYTYNKVSDEAYNALIADGSPFELTLAVGTVYNVTVKDGKSDADILTWVKANATLFPSVGTYEATADTEVVAFDNLAYGYYYITSSLGTAVTIDNVKPDAEIVDKNAKPESDKMITDANGTILDAEKNVDEAGVTAMATVGSLVEYTATITVDAGSTGYVFHDTMDATLAFTGTVTVSDTDGAVAEPVLDTDYTLTTGQNGDTFTVTFTDEYIAKLANKTVITIVYTATVTDAGLVADPATNTANITYNDPFGTSQSTPADKVDVYNASITVTKVDGATDAPLAGASFVLKNAENKYYKYTAATAEASAKVEWVDNEGDATVFTSNSTGNVINTDLSLNGFVGLADGTYTLVETVVPEGYNKAGDTEITISGVDYTAANLAKTATVENNSGSILPSTGGIGTTIFYVSGAVLAIAAVVFLVTKKRMSGEEE